VYNALYLYDIQMQANGILEIEPISTKVQPNH